MKRKISAIILAAALAVQMLSSCTSLDIAPTKNLREDQVFDNEVGVTAALASLYSLIPIAAHNASLWGGIQGDAGSPFSIWNNPGMVTGETQCTPLRVALTQKTCNGGMLSWWDYSSVRYANLVLKGLEDNAEAFADRKELYNHWLGEAYFCRAFMYFAMVRSYGGVPIVTTPESYVGKDAEALFKPRNTCEECYDFIAEDLRKAYDLMGDNELNGGRANKYIAAGILSRAMLTAASEAKYGSVQLDGLVGIPSSEAKKYYMLAYEAACMAMDNGGKYELYNVYNDGTAEGMIKNYWNLFIDESSANKERMFIKEYNASLSNARPENWTVQQMPYHYSMINDSGELSAPVEWLELFDDVDGNPFKLNVGPEDNPVRYDKTLDLFAKAQPRLKASVLVPGAKIPGRKNGEEDAVFEVRKGIYDSYPDGKLYETASFEDKHPNGMTIQGWCGVGSSMTNGNGCLVWKWCNPDATANWWAGSVDWIELRYAEVLLSKAEAAVNILGEVVDGKTVTIADAVEPINLIRRRAGTTELTGVDEDLVKRERRCELAFENRTFWDLKRWHMYEQVIQNKTFSALYPYYVVDEGKYIFKIHERSEIRYTYEAKSYYAPISTSVIAKSNRAIIQNPGY